MLEPASARLALSYEQFHCFWLNSAPCPLRVSARSLAMTDMLARRLNTKGFRLLGEAGGPGTDLGSAA
jgi:hypothetical protein